MTANVFIANRDARLPIHDEHTIRDIVNAVITWNRLGVDKEFRISRPSPNAGRRRSVRTVFLASQVDGVNVEGFDLTDLASPVEMTGAVAA